MAADAGADYAELGYELLGPVLSEQQVRALRAEEERFRPPLGYGRRDNKTLRVAAQLCHKSQPVHEVAAGRVHGHRTDRIHDRDALLQTFSRGCSIYRRTRDARRR